MRRSIDAPLKRVDKRLPAAKISVSSTVLDFALAARVIFVTGKGGVGKTTVVAALARAIAARGHRALVTEIGIPGDDYSPLAGLFGRHQLPREETLLLPNIHGVILLAQVGQELFAARTLRSKRLVRRIFDSDAIQGFLRFAPSCRELGIYYHLLSLVQKQDDSGRARYDKIIVDMPATGHALALTSLPKVIKKLFQRGPIARVIEEGQRCFNDPQMTRALVVTLADQLPVSETIELIAGLEQSDTAVGGIFVNRVTENLFTHQEAELLRAALSNGQLLGAETLDRIGKASRAIARLRADTRYPIRVVPEFATADLVAQIAAAIDGEPTA
ncbi:MAG: hypothetical protein H6707_02580 [Deltaproteobacteria bacterium]|nr:hypothetical protein [Deltaproteobacteria bacterium]